MPPTFWGVLGSHLNKQGWGLPFPTPGLTRDEVHSFLGDVHSIDRPRQGTFQLSDDRPIKDFPVSNLEFRKAALGRVRPGGSIRARTRTLAEDGSTLYRKWQKYTPGGEMGWNYK